jgi:hypothetical protein
MWKNLYDSFLQSMTLTWADFMRINHSNGRLVRDNFQNKIYPEIGIYFIFVTVVMALFFYYYLNARFGRYYTLKSWLLILGLNSGIVWLVTYLRAKTILQGHVIDVSKQLLWIGIINAVYAALLFFVISVLIKWASPMGKRTPF